MASKFLEALSPSVPSQFLAKIRARRAQASDLSDHRVWIFRNELRPSDLFCYLGARFGKPNGFQNYLRSDSSDNLIHWEWALDLDS